MKSFRAKMVLAFSIPVAILLMIFAYVFTNQIQNTILPMTEEMIGEIVSSRAVQLDTRLQEFMREAEIISIDFFSGLMQDMRTMDTGRYVQYQGLIRSELNIRQRKLREGFYSLFFIDPNGVLYESDGVTMREAQDDECYQTIWVQNRKTAISTPYVDANGEKKRPYIIHRTSVGCYERTLAWLIEKYAGMLPTWLCPEQVRVLPISEKYHDYARKVKEELQKNNVLVTVDERAEKIGYKIREARLERIPYMLIVGQKEEEEGMVSVRSRYLGDEGPKPLAVFIEDICREIRTKEIRKIEVSE